MSQEKEKVKKDIFEALMNIVAFFFLASWSLLFFLSSEFDRLFTLILVIIFTILGIFTFIFAVILDKKQKRE